MGSGTWLAVPLALPQSPKDNQLEPRPRHGAFPTYAILHHQRPSVEAACVPFSNELSTSTIFIVWGLPQVAPL